MSIIDGTNQTTSDPAVLGNPMAARIQELEGDLEQQKQRAAGLEEQVNSQGLTISQQLSTILNDQASIKRTAEIVMAALEAKNITRGVAEEIAHTLGFPLVYRYSVFVEATVVAEQYEVEIELLEENVSDLVDEALRYDDALSGKEVEEVDYGYFSETATISVDVRATAAMTVSVESEGPSGTSQFTDALNEAIEEELGYEWTLAEMTYEIQ